MKRNISRFLLLSTIALLLPSIAMSVAKADTSYNLSKMAMSGSGQIIYVVNTGGSIFRSHDAGTTWSALTSAGHQNWSTIATSQDGTVVVAAESNPGDLFVSTDSGATWTIEAGAGQHNWTTVTISSDGTKIRAIASGSLFLFQSDDGGTTWTHNGTLPTVLASGRPSNGCTSPCHVPGWAELTMSGTAQKIALLVLAPGSYDSGRQLFISQDGGVTWVETTGCCRDQSSYRQIASSRSDSNWTIMMGNYQSSPGYLRYDGSNWQSTGLAPASAPGLTNVVNSDTWKGFAIAADGNTAIFTGQFLGGGSSPGNGVSLFDGSISGGFAAITQITNQPSYYNDVAISDDGSVRAALQSSTGSIVVSTNSGTAYTSHLVFIPAPHISLSTSALGLVVGTAVANFNVYASGGPISSYSISPAVANGLSFDSTTGILSGTPLQHATDVQYTITATGVGGTSSATVDITINDAFVSPPGLSRVATNSYLFLLTTVGRYTYFSGNSSSDGEQLWVTDGTTSGTTEIGNAANISGVYPQNITPWNQGVAFLGHASSGNSLYVSNGTTAGTTPVNLSGAVTHPAYELVNFQNRLYFVNNAGFIGSTDGTVAGTSVTTIGQYPQNLTVSNGLLYYNASNELYSYDGINAPQQITGLSGDASTFYSPINMTPAGNLTIFGAINGSAWELFSTDGTTAGTHLITPSLSFNNLYNFGTSTNNPANQFATYNGLAYFIADNHLWKSDGTVGGTTQLVASGSGLYGAGVGGAFLGNTLYFASDLSDGRGDELQSYNTSTGTLTPISDIVAGPSDANPDNFAVLGHTLLFTASNNELWSFTPQAVVASTPIPDPIQQSKITSITPATVIVGTSTNVVVAGTFKEKLSNIQVNGTSLAKGSWIQTPTSITFTIPSSSAGKFAIQIYDGSAPVLAEQSFIVTTPGTVVGSSSSTTSSSSSSASSSSASTSGKSISKPKTIYLECIDGHHFHIVRGVNPICPAGFAKK